MTLLVFFNTTEETQIPFLERRMSYPEGSTFSIDDISQKLKPMKCKRHVSVLFKSTYVCTVYTYIYPIMGNFQMVTNACQAFRKNIYKNGRIKSLKLCYFQKWLVIFEIFVN